MLATGDAVAGYRIERMLARGGMGVVYLATQVSLDRQVALKVIAPELAESAEFRERFARESRLAAALDHPNVVPVHEAGEHEGVVYLAMRYVAGTDLATLIRAHVRLAPAHAVHIVAQVASALHAAHERGLVHRDVKPQNVLLTGPEGHEHAYLTDFGLTKRPETRAGLTTTGGWVGTLDYIAPEQLRDGSLDGRADVYALGCTLYEALAGRVPFRRESEVATLMAHLSDPPPPLAATVPEVPPELDAVVLRALAKDPDERWGSALELASAARAAVGTGTVVAPTPARPVPLGGADPRRRRHPGCHRGRGCPGRRRPPGARDVAPRALDRRRAEDGDPPVRRAGELGRGRAARPRGSRGAPSALPRRGRARGGRSRRPPRELIRRGAHGRLRPADPARGRRAAGGARRRRAPRPAGGHDPGTAHPPGRAGGGEHGRDPGSRPVEQAGDDGRARAPGRPPRARGRARPDAHLGGHPELGERLHPHRAGGRRPGGRSRVEGRRARGPHLRRRARRGPADGARRRARSAPPGLRAHGPAVALPPLHRARPGRHRQVAAGRGVRLQGRRASDRARGALPVLRRWHHLLAAARGPAPGLRRGPRAEDRRAAPRRLLRAGDRPARRPGDRPRRQAGRRRGPALGGAPGVRGAVRRAPAGARLRGRPLGGADLPRPRRARGRVVARRADLPALPRARGAPREPLELGRGQAQLLLAVPGAAVTGRERGAHRQARPRHRARPRGPRAHPEGGGGQPPLHRADARDAGRGGRGPPSACRPRSTPSWPRASTACRTRSARCSPTPR